MTADEQVNRFATDLEALCSRYSAEYDLTYASMVGVLQMQVHELCITADQEDEDEDEEAEGESA